MSQIKIYSKIKLLIDKYIEHGVKKGFEGYVIDIFNSSVYEIQFINPKTGELSDIIFSVNIDDIEEI